MLELSTTTYDYGCNTESYGPIRIATNVHPWLIRRSVRECVTWALCKFTFCYVHYFPGDQLTNYLIGECNLNNIASFLPMTKIMQNCPACKELGKI